MKKYSKEEIKKGLTKKIKKYKIGDPVGIMVLKDLKGNVYLINRSYHRNKHNKYEIHMFIAKVFDYEFDKKEEMIEKVIEYIDKVWEE